MHPVIKLCVPGEVRIGRGCGNMLPDMAGNAETDNITVFLDSGVMASGSADSILSSLNARFSKVILVTEVPPEPEDGQVRMLFDQVRNSGAKAIIAIGGGSVLDASKIISVMMTNPRYFSDLTDVSRIKQKGLPLYAVPTSAGTGSEATPNAIVLIPEKKMKVGVVHPFFMPDAVLLDPELTVSLPPSVTASTGLDAFCHCIETYISLKTNSFARLFGLKGLELINRYLRRACQDGGDMEARENLLLASFYGGVAIASSSTVAVHALSYPLGGSFRIPHGVSNAILLPYVIRFNIDAIHDCLPDIAGALGIDGGNHSKQQLGKQVVDAIFTLCRDVGIPDNLHKFGVSRGDLDHLTHSASEVHRLLDQNPKKMTLEDIRSIYDQLL